ncbi:MAG: hypothetical protein J7L53_13040 [Deltaproteobacteria bacterium]|nr:hypothetical protein [Deltaproteobacteria bacterium]
MKRKILHLIVITLLVLIPLSNAFAFDVSVEITGPEELTRLKSALEKSIAARCISKGIDTSIYNTLNITITQIGDVISIDAILDTKPPRGFHKDIKNINDISNAMDEMIDAVFVSIQTPLIEEKQADRVIHEQKEIAPVVLPFKATAITISNDTIFVSDKKTIYTIKDKVPHPWWKAPGTDEIFRIYSYKGSIIALVKHSKDLHTYRIKDGLTIKHWPTTVIPMGDGLISSRLMMIPDITSENNRWTKSRVIEGSPVVPPPGTDIIAATTSDVDPTHDGLEIISLSKTDKLKITNKGKTIWLGEVSIGGLSLYVEDEYIAKGSADGDTRIESHTRPVRYHLPPRITVTDDKEIITFANGQSVTKIFSNLRLYNSFQILAYKSSDMGLEKKVLYSSSTGRCADIAIQGRILLAVIVHKDKSKLLFINLIGA